ncbi:hypothetical protein OG870_17275 [Streptomyces sp. NBC_00461]|uniref:hypothetical protein n=1 Tax=Streptomyces sp. NBC_00461 TaxID=2975750 RepID=UPI002E17362B
MAIFTVEYTTPKDEPLRERRIEAEDFAIHGDFLDFTTVDGKRIFSVRSTAVVTISKEAAAP